MTETTVRLASAAAGMPVPEFLTHVLAQMPADVRLEVPDDRSVRELADAYAVGDRLTRAAGPIGRFILPSGASVVVEASAAGVRTAAELIIHLDPDANGHGVPRGADGVLSGHRIAVVTNVPAPYRLGLFERMQHRLAAAGADFRVFFSAGGQADRPWVTDRGLRFDHDVLRSVELPRRRRKPLAPLDLEVRLARYRPTVVLHGGVSPLTAPRAALIARRRGAAFGIWSGELADAPTARGTARSAFRRRMFAAADFVVVYGSLAAKYARSMTSAPVLIGRNSSDLPDGPRRHADGPRPVELLTVGDMAGRGKGIDVLLEAMRVLPSLDCRLTVIGGGALLDDYRADAGRDPRIRFTGALPHAAVHEQMLMADVYLTPTRIDRFGLALLEGMGSGLAPVMSPSPGARADLAVHGSNCLVVDDLQPESWATAMTQVCTDGDLRAQLARNARRTVRGRWTLDHAADAMIAGLRLGARRVRRP